MKRRGVFVVVVLMGPLLCAQENKPWNIHRLCGRLEHVEQLANHKHPDEFPEKKRPLPDTAVSLYERGDIEKCCKDSALVDRTTTDKRGTFEFRSMKPGMYWLATNWNGKEYQIAVAFKPENNIEDECAEQGVAIDDAGHANWWVTVTVD